MSKVDQTYNFAQSTNNKRWMVNKNDWKCTIFRPKLFKFGTTSYQKGLGAPFSVGDNMEIDVIDDDSFTLEEAEKSDS